MSYVLYYYYTPTNLLDNALQNTILGSKIASSRECQCRGNQKKSKMKMEMVRSLQHKCVYYTYYCLRDVQCEFLVNIVKSFMSKNAMQQQQYTFTRAEKQDHHHISRERRHQRAKKSRKKATTRNFFAKMNFFYSITNQHQIVCKHINIKFYRGESNWLSPLALVTLVLSNRHIHTKNIHIIPKTKPCSIWHMEEKGEKNTQ